MTRWKNVWTGLLVTATAWVGSAAFGQQPYPGNADPSLAGPTMDVNFGPNFNGGFGGGFGGQYPGQMPVGYGGPQAAAMAGMAPMSGMPDMSGMAGMPGGPAQPGPYGAYGPTPYASQPLQLPQGTYGTPYAEYARTWKGRYVQPTNPSAPPGMYPTHQFSLQYHAPRNLVYPPPNQPAGVVVYPYYTVRGPTDFFMDDENLLNR